MKSSKGQRAQKRQAVLLTSSDDQKMQIFVQVRKKNEKQWILKTVYSKRLVYFFQKSFLNLVFFGSSMERFCDKKIYVANQKKHGRSKKNKI